MSIFLPVCKPADLPARRLSVCLSVGRSVCLYVFLSFRCPFLNKRSYPRYDSECQSRAVTDLYQHSPVTIHCHKSKVQQASSPSHENPFIRASPLSCHLIGPAPATTSTLVSKWRHPRHQLQTAWHMLKACVSYLARIIYWLTRARLSSQCTSPSVISFTVKGQQSCLDLKQPF